MKPPNMQEQIIDRISQLDEYFLYELSLDISVLNTIKGFWEIYEKVNTINSPQFRKEIEKTQIVEKVALAIGELSEAIEALRKNRICKDRIPATMSTDSFERAVKDTFEDEIADAMIRLLDLTGKLNIDIWWHIKQKLYYNTTRPYKHGKTF